MRIKKNYQQQKKLLIVTQILLVSTLGNVWGTVWRKPLLITVYKGLRQILLTQVMSWVATL